MIRIRAKLVVLCLSLAIFGLGGKINALAQSNSVDAERNAAEYFRQSERLCEKDNGKLWGHSLCGAILLVDPETREAFANYPDNEGVLQKKGEIFVGVLPAKVNIANTATEWAGNHWMMVQLPLDADLYDRQNKMAHELWHRIQKKIGFPGSGAANNHLDSREGRIWLQMELRALQKALSDSGGRRLEAIKDALIFRAFRRSLFKTAGSEENSMEMHEGLAGYTGVRLSGHPKLEQYAARQVKEAEKSGNSGSFVRSFAYGTGPAYGILLDSVSRNWRKNLSRGSDFGVLLQRALRVRLPENLKTAAENAIARYEGAALVAAETERENKRLKLIAHYRARLVEGAVLEIPLQKMNMSFDPNNLIPLDPYGTVYPNIRIVDVWGILEVAEGGALISPNFDRIFVPAAIESNSRPIRGSGWTLKLNEGWSLEKGKREGDFLLKKAE